MEQNRFMAVACWTLLLGFRIKEMLEDDIEPGAEINENTIVHSERTRDLFQAQVGPGTSQLVEAALGCVANLYPNLLSAVQTSDGTMYVRSV